MLYYIILRYTILCYILLYYVISYYITLYYNYYITFYYRPILLLNATKVNAQNIKKYTIKTYIIEHRQHVVNNYDWIIWFWVAVVIGMVSGWIRDVRIAASNAEWRTPLQHNHLVHWCKESTTAHATTSSDGTGHWHANWGSLRTVLTGVCDSRVDVSTLLVSFAEICKLWIGIMLPA